PRWAGCGTRDRAAHGRAIRTRSLDRPPLTARAESARQVRKGGPRANGADEVRRRILDDTGESGQIDRDVVPLRRIADTDARPAAPQHDGFPCVSSGA